MALLTAHHITKTFATRLLFEDVSFEVNPRDRVGLIGVNGSGKTTLFRILAGLEPHDSGSVMLGRDTRIGVMEQSVANISLTLYQSTLEAFNGLIRMEIELENINHALSRPGLAEDEAMALASRQQALYSRYEAQDGLTYKSRTRSMLLGLGFSEGELEQPLETMSGGQRNKAQLARLLLSDVNLLLLDEPTNHFDLDSIAFLESFLSSYSGAFIVISHDRYFLDRVTNRTLELANERLHATGGNYTRHMELKSDEQELVRRRYMSAQKEIRRISGIVEQQRRWGQAHNFVTATAKLKQIERIRADLVEPEREAENIRFRFKAKQGGGNDVLVCENLSKAYAQPLFSELSLHVRKGERVFLLGPNGCGKTTLLKLIMGLEPADAGEIHIGTKVFPGYYEQHMASLEENTTALEAVWAHFPKLNTTQIRTAMAAFLFKGDDIEKNVQMLSGGERARIQLLKLMLAGENLLLLDEPTNHLDIPSREALESALESYDGTMLIVTHDRYLVNRLADRIVLMQKDGLKEFLGGYDDYLAAVSLQKEEQSGKPTAAQSNDYALKKQRQNALNLARGEARRTEERLSAAELELTALQQALGEPAIASDYPALAELSAQAEQKQQEIDQLYAAWETAMNQLSMLEENE